MSRNRIKCKYCDYSVQRFYGRKGNGRKLLLHVLDEHEDEFKAAMGIDPAMNLLDYLTTDEEEYMLYGQ